jgi:hypothetical protein
MDQRSVLIAILLGGLVAGTLDIGAAALINGLGVDVIAKFIAGGLLGKSAMKGGIEIAALGVVLQWAMSLIIAAVYVLASLKLPILRTQWIACGLAYGVVIYVVMNYVVMPLSAVGHPPRFELVALAKNMAAMLAFGLIIAWFARRVRSA